jgi:drug/metabolite transporter (DMT)-like permease
MKGRDAALLILLGAAWGAVYPLTALALRGYSPAAVVAGRAALSAVILLPAALRAGLIRAACERPLALAAGAVLQATLPVTLLTLGQRDVASGIAGIILASQPVWAAILTSVLDRALRVLELAAVAVGLGGIALLSWPSGGVAASAWGLAALIAAAFSYAAGAVYIQRFIPAIPPLVTATSALTVTAVLLVPFAAVEWTRAPGWASTGWLAALAVATGPALVLYYTLIHRTGPVRATVAGYLAPGFALLGSAFLGQVLTGADVAGLVLVLAGSYLATFIPQARGDSGVGRRPHARHGGHQRDGGRVPADGRPGALPSSPVGSADWLTGRYPP